MTTRLRRLLSPPAFHAVPRLAAVIASAAMSVALAACGTTTAAHRPAGPIPTVGPEAGVTSRYGSDVGSPSAPTTLAAEAATHAFTAEIHDDAAALVGSVTALQSDVARGDTATARTDELAAQGHYDAVRALESGNAVNASTLDELDTDVPAGQTFGGLHAVERDLWTGGPVAADVSSLAAQAPVAQFLLSRERLGPEAIGQVAVDELSWVVDQALPSSQERASHLGLVDVDSTVTAAQQAFGDIEPLARIVDPTRTGLVSRQFVALATAVTALGPATTTPDGSVSPATRLAASRQIDATASSLARLDAELAPFGTSGGTS